MHRSSSVLLADGDNLGVTNFCIDNGYLISRIDGTATTDKAFNTDSKLTVTFHNREGSYWIYFTDYISCSIVGGDSDDSLWLLVRKKPLADHLRRRMIALCDVFSLPSEYLVWKM